MANQATTQSGSRLTRQDAINIALMSQNIGNIQKQVQDIQDTLKSDFVKKEEFEPVRNLVYGFVVLIVVAVVGALVALVIIHPGQANTPTPVQTSVTGR